MPKRLDEQLLSKIEEIYLSCDEETYSSLAKRFKVGLSTLERLGRERGWARKRDQLKARRAAKLIKQSEIVTQSLGELDFSEFDQFSQKRLLRIVRKGLICFESMIDQNVDNPRDLTSLAGGLAKLVEVHVRLQPLTVSDFVEILIQANISPDDFLNQLRREKECISLAVKK